MIFLLVPRDFTLSIRSGLTQTGARCWNCRSKSCHRWSNNSGHETESLHDVAVDLPELAVGEVELPERDDRDAHEGKVPEERLDLSPEGQRQLRAAIGLHLWQLF